MSQDEKCTLTETASSEKAALKQFQRSWDGEEKITMRGACQEAERYLASCEIADAAVDAWYLLEYVTGVSRAKYLADRDKRLSRKEWDAYAALIEKRGAHIPLQHLTGEQEFMGLPFLVNEDVLIPRQDTELLAETALTILKTEIPGWTLQRPPYRVLDLCTGSGCIAISIAKLFKQWWSRTQCIKTQCSKTAEDPGKSSCEEIAGDSVRRSGGWASESGRVKSEENVGAKAVLEIYASDISEAALVVARGNAERLDADVHFIQSDLFDGITREFWFDMIVSNPPYICTEVIDELDEEVRLHEPHLALDGGEDGLVIYRRIIRESADWLSPGGWLLFEIGYDQGEAVSELMRQHGFSGVRVTKDLAGLDRVVSGQWRAQENAANDYTMKENISGLTGSDGTSAQENAANSYTMEGV